MTKVKVCGITNLKDAVEVIRLGANSIGFNFNIQSPRYINPETAKDIIDQIPKKIKSVGLFANDRIDKIHEIVNITGIDIIQLHENENPEFTGNFCGPVIKAIRERDSSNLKAMVDFHFSFDKNADYDLLFEKLSQNFNINFAIEASKFGMVILTGGINEKNLLEAVLRIKPYCIDLCEQIEEKPGTINYSKAARMFEIINNFRNQYSNA